MSKFTTPEQFIAPSKVMLNNLTTLVSNIAARSERLTALNLNTARAVLEDSVAGAQTLMDAKSPQELAELEAALPHPMIDKALAYARSVYEIATEGQHEIAALFDAQFAEINKTFEKVLDQAVDTAPAGSEGVFSSVKSALAASSNAYENANKAAWQLVEAAEGNLAAATEATTKALIANKDAT